MIGRVHPDLTRFSFSILKHVPFKKLNRTRRSGLVGIGKFSNPFRLHLIFVFILYFVFYYIKINIFHKNKNIMNFYKLFIKKILIIIIIYIKV